jgi:predicted dehydrogenase
VAPRPIDVIHIGLGERGRFWLDQVARHPGFRSVACVHPDPAAHEWVHRHHPHLRSDCYTQFEDATARAHADAAIVAAPLSGRAGHAVEALNAGLSVLIERPFANSLREAARVIAATRGEPYRATVVQPGRFAACQWTLRQYVRAGTLGSVTLVSCADRRAAAPTHDALEATALSQVWLAAVDDFDSIRGILGRNAVAVIARAPAAAGGGVHGSITDAIVEMEGGIYMPYHGSLVASRSEHALWIDGDRGSIWTDRVRVWWRQRGWPVFVPVRRREASRADGVGAVLDQFRSATTDRVVAETSAADNLGTLAMVEAAVGSMATESIARIGDLLGAAGLQSIDRGVMDA